MAPQSESSGQTMDSQSKSSGRRVDSQSESLGKRMEWIAHLAKKVPFRVLFIFVPLFVAYASYELLPKLDVNPSLVGHKGNMTLYTSLSNALNEARIRESHLHESLKEAQNMLKNLKQYVLFVRHENPNVAISLQNHLKWKRDVRLNSTLSNCVELYETCKVLEKQWTLDSTLAHFREQDNITAIESNSNFTNCLLELSQKCGGWPNVRVKEEKCEAIRISKILETQSEEKQTTGKFLVYGGGVWKLVPSVTRKKLNISFMLQYFHHPASVSTIVERLYTCTNGRLGTGNLTGITSELLVNVDEASNLNLWRDLSRMTKAGNFMKLIFNHNLHETRGYNFLKNFAESDVLVLIQDDNILHERCEWIEDIIKNFNGWPKLAAIGLWRGAMSHYSGKRRRDEFLGLWPDATERAYFPLCDPVTKTRMHFVNHVNVGPVALRRSYFEEIGGTNEGLFGEKGSCGIYHDEDFNFRFMLAGYTVAQIFLREAFEKGPEGPGTRTEGTLSTFLRNRHQFIQRWLYFQFTAQGREKRFADEVFRLNNKLLCPDRWPLEFRTSEEFPCF